MDTSQLMLEELRELKQEFKEFRQAMQPWMIDTGQRLTAVETNCDACGIKEVKERLEGVERWHWRVAGAWGAIGGAFTALLGLAGLALRFWHK
jgi:hypothetical protein